MLKSPCDAVVLLDVPFRPDPDLWRRVAAEGDRCPSRRRFACDRPVDRCEATAARCVPAP